MKETGFERHVRACNNAVLPGERIPFHIGDASVGWVTVAVAEALRDFPAIRRTTARVTLTDAEALPGIGRVLAERGLCRWRDEMFDVRERPDLPPVALIDRGAIPAFGIRATGIHVNGLVQRADGLHVWVA